jgi:hypothetical protein
MGTELEGLVLREWLQDGVKNVNKLPFLSITLIYSIPDTNS